MTPTIGRILHVGYLERTANLNELPCRAAIVTGDLTTDTNALPVTVFVPNRPPHAAYVDLVTGWHDPRSCPRASTVGPNDGQRSDPQPVGSET